MVDDTERVQRRKPPTVPPGGAARRPWVLAIGEDAETVTMLRGLAVERGMRWLACGDAADRRAWQPVVAGDRLPDVIFVLDAAALEQVRCLRKELQEIVLVLEADRRVDREACRHADIAVLCRPLDRRFLGRLLDEVVEECRRAAGCFDPAADSGTHLQRFRGLHGSSAAMRQLFAHMQRMAGSTGSVLIYGERGTGKARAALALHQASRSSSGPFVSVECRDGLSGGAESGPLVAGASSRSSRLPERVEAARGGTLFLNHVNDLSCQVQIQVLRVLDSPPFSRSPGPGAVRVIAAVDRDPLAAIRAGQLRQDLYDRLARFVLRMPPLRERGHDLVDLARLFLGERNRQSGSGKVLSRTAVEAMCRHAWPGNVGELKNVIEHAHARAGPVIGPEDLPSAVGGGDPFPDREAGELRNIV